MLAASIYGLFHETLYASNFMLGSKAVRQNLMTLPRAAFCFSRKMPRPLPF